MIRRVRMPVWLVFGGMVAVLFQPARAAADETTGQGDSGSTSPYSLYSPPYSPQSAPAPQETGSAATYNNNNPYRSPVLNPWASSQPGGVHCGVAAATLYSSPSGATASETGLTGEAAPERTRSYNIGKRVVLVPSVSLSEIYSDNITLRPDHTQSDFITELRPGLNACAQMPRFRGDLSYSLQGLYYARYSSHNAVYSQLGADTTTVLLPRHVFFSANTSYGQAVINPAQPYSTSNVLDTGNTTNVWTFNLSPYVEQGLGRLGHSTLRYTYGRVLYANNNYRNGNSGLSDTTSNTASAQIVNPQTNELWTWKADYRTQQLQRSGNVAQRTVYFDTASLQLGYKVRTNFEILAQGGIEDRYNLDGTTDRLASPFWNAGFRWATAFNDFELRYGHRFFGPTYTAKWQLNLPRLKAAMTYNEQPTESNNEFLNMRAGQQNGQLLPNVPVLQLNQYQIYISKRLSADIDYALGQTKLTLGGYSELRQYRASGVPDERVQDADVSWIFPLGVRTSLTPRWTWQRYDQPDGRPDYLQQELLTLGHRLGLASTARLVLRHQSRTSHAQRSGYKENAVILEYSRIF